MTKLPSDAPLHPMTLRRWPLPAVSALACLCAGAFADQGTEFFEAKIRPVLAAECYECHDAKKQKGGLRLDWRDGWRKGGDSGDVIVPGDAAGSLLIQAIRHDDPDLKMPSKAPKLDDAVIADFVKWVNMGAPDPRDAPPSDQAGKPSWADALVARRGWWSLQPVRKVEPPAVRDGAWSEHPVDRFLLAKMEARGLAPAADTDPRTLMRRLSFALTGLPPTPEEVDAFVRDSGSGLSTFNSQLSTSLGSPRFGEHWARHWMDLVRYADTHGSEGDFDIPEAWRYRDYLIRAFNADVPLDQLIREHLAGDLLAQPRWNREEEFNESMLGTAHLRLVEHGFQPIDTLDEQVKVIESQIDVAMKAFQGLTVTCARCHDHKFDAISQRDYYALAGVFASSRPAMVTIDSPERLAKNRAELLALKPQIKAALAEAWLTEAARIPERLLGVESSGWKTAIADAEKDKASPLHAWAKLRERSGEEFVSGWAELSAGRIVEVPSVWNLAGAGYAQCFHSGTGLANTPARCGEFAIAPEGDRILSGLQPAGAFTGALSRKHGGVFATPRFKVESDFISVRACGSGAWVRLIVDGYPLGKDSIFPRAALDKDQSAWITIDVKYRRGSMAYLEFATANDLTLQDKKPADGRSWFGVERIVFHDAAGKPAEPAPVWLAGEAPRSPAELAAASAQRVQAAIAAWRDDTLAEEQRALLDWFVRRGLLPVTLPQLEKSRPLVAEYRRLEAEIPLPRHAPGVLEADGYDAPFLPRGDHLKPGEPVPRAFLAVLGGEPFQAAAASGRRQLADAITNSANPLTARVMVNRVWHWLFGRGLVGTPDNFGRMGEKPTHPELLDFLAAHCVENRWSAKELIRFLVTTRAFRMSSEVSADARERDPGNEWLSHFRIRRLEAESLRDTLLAVSGRLDTTMFGPGMDARAPADQQTRRSVYFKIRRTDLSPFLDVFDAPKPFSTLGRRDATNVPAQSLTLLNDPLVIELARRWSRAEIARTAPDAQTRIRAMFTRAFARPPSDDELRASHAFLESLADERQIAPGQRLANEPLWQDFAQSLFNLKEFIFLR